MTDRIVQFGHSFFEALDQALPESRTTGGNASASDFLLFELPPVRDLLAADFEGHTVVLPPGGPVRVYIGSGTLVERFALYATLIDEKTVEVLDIYIEQFEQID